MITEEEIIQILNEWEFGANLKNGEFVRGVKKEYYKDIAEAIVKKNLPMHDVSNLLLCGGIGSTAQMNENSVELEYQVKKNMDNLIIRQPID